MATIKIHKDESPLKDYIRENNTLAYTSAVLGLTADSGLSSSVASIVFNRHTNKVYDSIASATDEDLYYIRTILVTASREHGNLNEDWFLPEDTWAARNTPVHKMFNNNHTHNEIIGHIVSSDAVDDKYNAVLGDPLPPKFHLITSAVIYRFFRDASLTQKASELIDAIKKGRKYVSMECTFSHFDYAVKDSNGWMITPRNESSSYLTKHLKAYGGKGVYDGKKVQRVIRKMTFSGKGLVDTPANPESIIVDTGPPKYDIFSLIKTIRDKR